MFCGSNNINKDELIVIDGNKTININNIDQTGSTALLKAAPQGYTAIVSILLSCKEINVEIGDNNGDTAILVAVLGEYSAIVDLLTKFDGIDLSQYYTYLFISAVQKEQIETIKELLLTGKKTKVHSWYKYEPAALIHCYYKRL